MTLTAMTKEQLRNLDVTAITAGLPEDVLMERGGMALADFLMERIGKGETVLFLCGPGNNGGDGYVAARHLANKGVSVSVVMSKEPRTPVASNNKNILEQMSVPLHHWEQGFSFTPYDNLVDCLLGYGQKDEPEGAIKEMIIAAKKSGKDCYACDLPSGVDADTGKVYATALPVKATISFAAPKKCFGQQEARALCGAITIAGIGIPRFVYELILPGEEFLVEGTAPYP